MDKLPGFCADVHVGKFATMLRMSGFDVVYRNDFTPEELQSELFYFCNIKLLSTSKQHL